jgi:23S rRNA (adenine2503-C2)-methyltransferase
VSLSGIPLAELTGLISPLPAFRGEQIFSWIARGCSGFSGMTDLPVSLREELAGRFSIYSTEVETRLEDGEGAVKLGIRLRDEARVEAVLLSDRAGRKTACLSTQAGCAMGCVFCKTGSLGFYRNLDSAEIVEQLLYLQKAAGKISNIVFMGMGEPLLNLAELRRALSVICDPRGLGFSGRRITVSTCGIASGILDLADNGPRLRLALSLTTAVPALRERLMPSANPLPALKKALLYWQSRNPGRLTLEAVLLGGLNTSPQDAAALADFAAGLDVVVNLIPWNRVEGLSYQGLRTPSVEETGLFAAALEGRGLKVTRRYRRGKAIDGACGQLGAISAPG